MKAYVKNVSLSVQNGTIALIIKTQNAQMNQNLNIVDAIFLAQYLLDFVMFTNDDQELNRLVGQAETLLDRARGQAAQQLYKEKWAENDEHQS